MDPLPSLPLYSSHQTVQAIRIAGIDKTAGTPGAILVAKEPGLVKIPVDDAFLATYKPAVGGYYVIHSDGAKSFWSGRNFEAEYSLNEPGTIGATGATGGWRDWGATGTTGSTGSTGSTGHISA